MSNEELISRTFYDPISGYVGSKKLYERLKDKGVTLKEIKEFLANQEVVQVNTKSRGKLGSFVPVYPLYQFQIDLVYIENKGLNKASYALTCIDTFSKMADVELMQNKTMVETVRAMEEVFKGLGIPEQIYCDEGSEFNNYMFRNLCKENDIELILTLKHATMIERFNRTLKEMISKYLQATKSKTITNILPKVVKNYNSSFHSTIEMAPDEVNKKNQHEVYNNILEKATIKNRPVIRVGDKVRIQLKSKSFQKGYSPKWSKTIHTIEKKDGRYYVVNDDNRKYLRAYLQKVENSNAPEIDADLKNTKEGFLKALAKKPRTRSYVEEEPLKRVTRSQTKKT
eukprot:Lithocolla_globosa_v1_NODE_4016_length_1528_cov_244.244399.p1 type:complete len:341 gc:universal NODE_4016_length_1528_cov_244.244399:1199-177(-)